MTDFFYTLPESDRIAEFVNPALEEIVENGDVQAALSIEAGALMVMGFYNESKDDYKEQVVADAARYGVSRDFAVEQVDTVFASFEETFHPRVIAAQNAVQIAKGVFDKNGTPDVLAGLENLLAGLLGSLVGDEAAEEFRAEAKAEREAVTV